MRMNNEHAGRGASPDKRAYRTAAVRQVSARKVTYSSIVQIGDAESFAPITQALAVTGTQDGPPGPPSGSASPAGSGTFTDPLPMPFMAGHVQMQTRHDEDRIVVGMVDVLSVSSSSLLAVGSLRNAALDSRTLTAVATLPHIRGATGVEST